MNAVPLIALAIALYLVLLVIVGWRADRRASEAAARWRGVRYGLSLATLCSAWTYFGAVGDASEGSWLFIANAIGPIIALTLLAPVWRRIAVLAKQENVGSLADFLAARFGKSRALGILATLVATLAALPYIALQLAVLAHVWAFAVGGRASGADSTSALVMLALLAILAVAFGTRRPSLTQHSRGFVSMIAVEAVVKLGGLLAVAALVAVLLHERADGGIEPALALVPPLPTTALPSFIMLSILCTITAFTLPRQFHLGFVTLETTDDIKVASRVVPAYFTLWVVATLVIALGIRSHLGMPGQSPYLQMLAIPLLQGHTAIAALALLGGLSAGGAMVVVELTAISAMVSNEIVLPLGARWLHRRLAENDVGAAIVLVRRIVIVVIAALAWAYYGGVRGVQGPTELGLTALTASAQLVPPLIGGIYWRRGHAHGAIAGVSAGIAVWLVAIAAPAFAQGDGLGRALWPVAAMPWANAAIALSLMANSLCFVVFSLRAQPRLIDAIQANSFVLQSAAPGQGGRPEIGASVADLRRLLAQFLGRAEADRTLDQFARQARSLPPDDAQPVSAAMVRAAERVLAGVIGASSARNVVAIAMAVGGRDAEEIGRILDEASHAVQFSRELLQTTLDSLPQGVCVLDGEGLLVAWNARSLDLLGLPAKAVSVGAVAVGRPLADLLALAEIDRLDPAWREWRAGQASRRAMQADMRPASGRMLSLAGKPLAGGDYLLTLADVTDLKQAERVLTQDRTMLEQRVEERTRALTEANAALEQARRDAEQATGAQRRFVAAASHDLVQPMHAARLFIGNAMLAAVTADQRDLLAKADQAVEGAHRMLQALLTLSQLELGALQPRKDAVDAAALMRALAAEFEPVARARGLQLVVMPTRLWLHSDRDLLRSILQNLLVNALRYTPHGRIVMLARRRGGMVRLEVRDSGVGMSDAQLPLAFREFSRLAEGQVLAEGTGLGLSIVARIAAALGHGVEVSSRKGVGSVFSVIVPASLPAKARVAPVQAPADLAGMAVLCVDDDPDILQAIGALIERWGGAVTRCAGVGEVPPGMAWDAAIADYQLDDGNGLDLLRDLAGRCPLRILVTATPGGDWAQDLPAEGICLLAKPAPPLALQALLVQQAPKARVSS